MKMENKYWEDQEKQYAELTDIYESWGKKNGFSEILCSADDFLFEHQATLTQEQRRFLKDFIHVWESVDDLRRFKTNFLKERYENE